MQITTLSTDIKNLISSAQIKAINAVDTQRVLLYHSIGKRIYEELQGGEDRATYGKQVIKSSLVPTVLGGNVYTNAINKISSYTQNSPKCIPTQERWGRGQKPIS